jgi:TldD protein
MTNKKTSTPRGQALLLTYRSFAFRGSVLSTFCLFTLTLLQGASAQTVPAASAVKAASADPLLNAMQTELDRERGLLFLPGLQKPYFIEYRLDDFTTWEALANYGALTREERNHQRIVRVTVRIGDYASDSSSARGEGSVELAPEDNNPEALRYALWTTTDEAYKAALRAYANKQAALKRFEKASTEADFSRAAATQQVESMQVLSIDEPEWKRRIVDASGVFVADKSLAPFASNVQYSTASVRGFAVNHLIVNTEGSVLRHGYSGYSANIGVGTQAADGMRLNRENGTTAPLAAGLESAAAFHQRAVDDIRSLQDLRNAPVVAAEDFHGPVLFSGDAASDVMNRLFVPNIEADRPEMGTTARTTGAYQSSLKTRVLPDFLDVVDDPLVRTFEGQELVGAYRVDDEGVPAQKVDLVDHGKLMSYVTGRTPIRDFPVSNGHGRAAPGQAAHARAGVVVFKSVAPVAPAEMQKKLVALAKEQERDVYEVQALGGDLDPRMLYQVHPDGTRQLVRGAVFDELDNRSLRSEILAAGSDEYVNNQLGAVPETTIAPSLLFGDIGVKRATEEQQKLPYYGPPAPGQP